MQDSTFFCKIVTSEIDLETSAELDWKDITSLVRSHLVRSGMKEGFINIFVPGSTGGLITIEAEKGLLLDLTHLSRELIPRDNEYEHEKAWHDGNAHSHLRASLFGASISVPFSKGQLLLGAWQQIVFVEFDIRPRKRKLIIQCIGI